MEIGRLQLESGAEWVVYDPVAKLISRYNGQITVDGLGKINASKPLRRGELEYFNPRYAADYITMPKRISNIERLLEDFLRGNRADNKCNCEDQIDEVREVGQIATAAEKPKNNSDEEVS